ncbi:uncharacterized protein [Littorina saxatilis]|uniref:uncharacterized protein n=1 Tax=Littorina saxatilis TaxID=31220 RepID=UPI0038B538CE
MLGYVKILNIATILQYVRLCACLNNYSTENGLSNVGGQDSITSQLTSIMERLTSIDQRFNALDQRVTALDQRVTTLNQRVNTLDNRVSDMQQRSGHATEVNNNLMTTTTDTPSPTPKPSTMFCLTRVTKEELTDFYKVRVEYEASSKPTHVLLRLNWQDTATLQEDHDFGVVELYIPKESILREEDYVEPIYLLFNYPDISFTAYLQMNNTPNSVEVPRITAQIAQGNDVTYKPGSDARFDVEVKVEGDSQNIRGDSGHCMAIVKSDTEENRVDRYPVNVGRGSHHRESLVWLERVSEPEKEGDRRGTFLINSTLFDPRGILELYARIDFCISLENCLLEKLEGTATVRFYSEDHSGPFPEGFLGFVHDHYSSDLSQVFCDVRRRDKCTISCEVMGSDLCTAELSKILPSGDVIPTDDFVLSSGHRCSSQLSFANITYADAGDFRCTAKSGSKEITLDMALIVVKAPRINKDLSQVTHFENGSVAATCTAEGNPAPNVTFSTKSYPLDDASPGDYDVTMTQLDESTTRADIIVINPDVASSMYSFECNARNVDGHMYGDFHYFSMDGN